MNTCANCHTEVSTNFCGQCGQPVRSRRGPIWQIIHEFTEEVFAPNSKVLVSLYTLFIKPGGLTKKFLDGQRVSILPPVRMYLVVSVIFFFVFQIPTIDVKQVNIYVGDVLLGREVPLEDAPKINIFSTGDTDNRFSHWVNGIIEEKKELMLKNDPQVTIDRLMNRLEDLLPTALFLFLPLFALLLKFLYIFKRVLYFDHLIFALHFQTWLMGFVLIIYGLVLLNGYWSFLAMFLPYYLAKAQKTVYQQSYGWIVPKTLVILVTYILIGSLCSVFAFFGAIALLE